MSFSADILANVIGEIIAGAAAIMFGVLWRQARRDARQTEKVVYSPDKRFAAFQTTLGDGKSDWNIWVLDTQSNQLRQVTQRKGLERVMRWDNNGLLIDNGGSMIVFKSAELLKWFDADAKIQSQPQG